MLGLRSTLPRDRALSQPLLHLTVPNSTHFIGSSSDRFPLGLPYSGLIAASPEGPPPTAGRYEAWEGGTGPLGVSLTHPLPCAHLPLPHWQGPTWLPSAQCPSGHLHSLSEPGAGLGETETPVLWPPDVKS